MNGTTRGASGVVIAFMLGVLPALAQPAPILAATSTGTLFAITGSEALATVDPGTGTLTTIADLNTPDSPQSNALASDPYTHRLFAVRTTMTGTTFPPVVTQELLTIDSRTGAILSNPQFTGFAPQSLAFDPTSAKLFGFNGQAIVRVDPATAATTTIATISSTFGAFIYSLALDSSTHTLYLSEEDVSGPVETNTTRIVSMSTSGGPISTSPVLATTVREIAVDTGSLFGVAECCSTPNFVGIDFATGATTPIATIGDSSSIIQFGSAVDAATHTVYLDTESQDPVTFNWIDHIVSINDQTGSSTLSPGLPDTVVALGLAFEPTVTVTITPASTLADVQSAVQSGAISNSGVATALLAQLDAASAARARGQCATAASIYEAFINTLAAQRGQFVAATTAAQLTGDAQFLIAHCP